MISSRLALLLFLFPITFSWAGAANAYFSPNLTTAQEDPPANPAPEKPEQPQTTGGQANPDVPSTQEPQEESQPPNQSSPDPSEPASQAQQQEEPSLEEAASAPSEERQDPSIGTPETTEFSPLDVPIEGAPDAAESVVQEAEAPNNQKDPPRQMADGAISQLQSRILAVSKTSSVAYHIRAELDPEKKVITGFQRLDFTNYTSVPLHELYFQLDLNAFKNEGSTFWNAWKCRGHKPSGDTAAWGYLDVGRILLSGQDVSKKFTFFREKGSNPLDQTIARLPLDAPLNPGQSTTLEMDFTAKLPLLQHATGYRKDFFMVAHWFPKLAALQSRDREGFDRIVWAHRAYHPGSGSSGNFASFHVEISLPKDWQIGSTGMLVQKNEAEMENSFVFEQEMVRDFAFSASPDLVSITRRFDPAQWIKQSERLQAAENLGIDETEMEFKPTEIILLLQSHHTDQADRFFDTIFQGLKLFSLELGPYPYDTLTFVEPAWRAESACRHSFPTLTIAGISWPHPKMEADLAFQIFYGIAQQYWTASIYPNESWLGSGLATFSSLRLLQHAIGDQHLTASANGIPLNLSNLLGFKALSAQDWFGAGLVTLGNHKPLHADNPVYDFSPHLPFASRLQASAVLHQLSIELGKRDFDRALQSYYRTWHNGHPCTRDFQAVFEDVAQRDLDWFFDAYVYQARYPDFAVERIENEPMDQTLGYLETRTGRELVKTPGQAKKLSGSLGLTGFRSIVVVSNHGGAPHDVEVLIDFKNGQNRVVRWDGMPGQTEWIFESESPITRVTIDPNRKIFLDINPMNDRRVSAEASIDFDSRWSKSLVFLQHIIQSVMGVF